MGRADGVQVILEVVAECRRLIPNLVVSYEPGWETRGNGSRPNYDFGTWHHTASATSAAKPFPTQTLLRVGRSDLPGPLCNFAGPWCTVEQPRLHVMAVNPGNHAGASRASGPVPALSLFNPRTLGLEIDYAGVVPMTPGQALVAKAWGRAVAKVVGGGNIEVVRAHAETSVTGKFDIGFANGKTYDMAAFRREAAALSPGSTNTPAPEEDDDMLQMIRNDDTGEMVLAGPGLWYKIPDPVVEYVKMYVARGFVRSTTADVNCRNNEFLHFRTVYLSANPLTPVLDYQPHHGNSEDNLLGHVLSIRQEVEGANGGGGIPVNVDAAAVVAGLVANQAFAEAIAERTAAKIADRLQS